MNEDIKAILETMTNYNRIINGYEYERLDDCSENLQTLALISIAASLRKITVRLQEISGTAQTMEADLDSIDFNLRSHNDAVGGETI